MSRARYAHLALAAGLLALLLWRTDITGVGSALRHASPLTVIAVVALDAPVALLFWLRSRMVLGRLGHQIPARVLLPVALLGNVAGSMTPASAGELLRTTMLKSHAEVTAKDGFALVLYERALSVYLMALGTGVVAAFVVLPLPAASLIAAIAALLCGLPLSGSMLLSLLPKRRIARGPALLQDLIERVVDVVDRLEWLLRDRTLLLAWTTITGAIFALVMVQFWLLSHALSDAVSPQEAWLAFGASQLAAIVSLVPLGLGAADGSIAAILRRAGMTLEQGTAVAVLVRATITLPLGLAAVGCYLYLQHVRRAEPQTGIDASV